MKCLSWISLFCIQFAGTLNNFPPKFCENEKSFDLVIEKSFDTILIGYTEPLLILA